MPVTPTLTLDSLNSLVEEKVAEGFPRLLLDIEVERHTRRGLRPDCGCDYCATKRNAFAAVKHATSGLKYPPVTTDSHVKYFGSCGVIYTEHWMAKEMARLSVRRRWREHMREVKECVE